MDGLLRQSHHLFVTLKRKLGVTTLLRHPQQVLSLLVQLKYLYQEEINLNNHNRNPNPVLIHNHNHNPILVLILIIITMILIQKR